MKRNLIIDTISFLFVLLFLYTGLDKLMELQKFRSTLHSSPLIGKLAPVIAIGLPVLEIAIGATLIGAFLWIRPRLRLKGLYAATILMAVFTLYIEYMLLFAPHLPCSCGGIIQKMSWRQHLYFNIGFTLLGIWAIWLSLQQDKKGAVNMPLTA
jgi:hypothetical protein